MATQRQTSLFETSAEGERKWKNPNEVVRIRRKLSKKPTLKLTGKHCRENPHTSIKSSRDEKSRTPVSKRMPDNLIVSPTPPKRSRSGLQDISNSPLATPDKNAKPHDSSSTQQVQVATPTVAEQPTTHRQPLSQSLSEPDVISDSDLPLDWALKTKVHFVSPFPFSWTQSLKPHQEASGITQFMGCNSSERSSDPQTLLQQGLMVWHHPSLPFLKTFPRTENRQKTTPTPALLQDEAILQSLKDDWSTSFYSVYQLLKCGHCPYFYLCANQFTVLFTSAGVCGCPSLSAMITPTTTGMREALKKEGAKLSLPLAPTSLPGCDEEDCSDAEDDSAAASWLTTMGLPAHDFPTLHPQKIALQRSREVNIDNHPESMVHVEGGSNVHVLFNYLLTSKTTITTTGSHAGVPPTILALVGFKGATLKALKVKQGSVQEQREGQMTKHFYLEISGPILPHNLHTLSSLFQKTQHGHFTARMNNVNTTGAFNAAVEHKVDAATDTIVDSYLQRPPPGQKIGLKELVCESSHFTWT